MTEPLDRPRSADDLYLARAADSDGVSVLRPIMTGDVFHSVEIPGVEDQTGDDEKLVVVVSHPCSMRNGPDLKTHVQASRVLRCEPIKLDEWPKRHYDLMPLPDLTVVVDLDDVSSDDPEAEMQARVEEGAHAGFFDLRGRVESGHLQLANRIACMTEQGVALMHQRMAHNDTRYAPGVDDLIAACMPVFAEIELWEQWNEQLIDLDSIDDAAKLQEELTRVSHLFDDELSRKRQIPDKKNGWYTLRADLGIQKRHAAARREILKLLGEQRAALSKAGLKR